MTRIALVDPEELEGFQEVLARQEDLVGIVPESLLTMAHRPRMAAIFSELASEVLGPGSVAQGLKQLVATVASATAGCRYCQAHTSVNAERLGGVPIEKIQAVFQFDTSELFTEAERAALRLAHDAAISPNMVTDEHFDQLKKSFSNEQIAELVGVIALFGWLNRWNDTMATTLEVPALEWAKRTLTSSGWTVGKHAKEVQSK